MEDKTGEMGPWVQEWGVVKGGSRYPAEFAQSWGTQEDKELLGAKLAQSTTKEKSLWGLERSPQ